MRVEQPMVLQECNNNIGDDYSGMCTGVKYTRVFVYNLILRGFFLSNDPSAEN